MSRNTSYTKENNLKNTIDLSDKLIELNTNGEAENFWNDCLNIIKDNVSIP